MAISNNFETKMSRVVRLLNQAELAVGTVNATTLTVSTTRGTQNINWIASANGSTTSNQVTFDVEAGATPNMLILKGTKQLMENVVENSKEYYEDFYEVLNNLKEDITFVIGKKRTITRIYDFTLYETSSNVFDYGGVYQNNPIVVLPAQIDSIDKVYELVYQELVVGRDWTVGGYYQGIKIDDGLGLRYFIIRSELALNDFIGNRNLGFDTDASKEYKIGYDLSAYDSESVLNFAERAFFTTVIDHKVKEED